MPFGLNTRSARCALSAVLVLTHAFPFVDALVTDGTLATRSPQTPSGASGERGLPGPFPASFQADHVRTTAGAQPQLSYPHGFFFFSLSLQ